MGAILDKTEQLNPDAMYAIYEQAGGTAALGREDEDDDLPMDISEAEEKMRVLRDSEPEEFQRILELRDGIRSATKGPDGTSFVFCGAGRYHQLMLVDSRGHIVERDVPSVLNVVKCSPDTPTAILPKGHNRLVTSAKRVFEEEVQHRQAQQRHTLSLTHAQRYVLRELKIYHAVVREEDIREQVAALDQAFRLPMTSALNRELNRLRRNGVAGKALVQSLRDLYNQHGMREWKDRDRGRDQAAELPRIICSEGFVG